MEDTADGADPTHDRSPVPDEAAAALADLVSELTAAIATLAEVRGKAETVLERRTAGESYTHVVRTKERPFVVEQLSEVLTVLGRVGARYRRAQARALRAEGGTVPEIAELFGVSRQRISALLEPDRDAS